MKNPYEAFDEYGLRYLPSHLVEVEEWEAIEEILTDLIFIETKCCLSSSSDTINNRERPNGVYLALDDFDLAVSELISISPPKSSAQFNLLKRLQEIRTHLWTAASALSLYPHCTIQQLANRLQWSSDKDLKTRTEETFKNCLKEGRRFFRELLPAPSVIQNTQRIWEENDNIVGAAMIEDGLVLWSQSGQWRIVNEKGSTLENGTISIGPAPRLESSGATLAAISGRMVFYWRSWQLARPKGKRQVIKPPFMPKSLALACQGQEMLLVADDGHWIHYSIQGERFVECNKGRLESQITCCAMSFCGDYWIIGTRSGNIFMYHDTSWRSFPAHDGMVQVVAVHPEGKLIASGGQDDQLRLFSPDGSLFHSVNCSARINDLVFSEKGREVIGVTESGQLLSVEIGRPEKEPRVWTVEQTPLIWDRLFPRKPEAIRGSVVAVLGADKRARLITCSTNTVSRDWQLPLSGNIVCLDDWNNGKDIIAVDSHGNRYTISLKASPAESKKISITQGTVKVAAIIQSDKLVTVYGENKNGRIVESHLLSSNQREKVVWPGWFDRIWSIGFYRTIRSAAFTPDRKILLFSVHKTGSRGSLIKAYDIVNRKVFHTRDCGQMVDTIAASNGAQSIFLGSSSGHRPLLVQNKANEIELPVHGCDAVAISASGDKIVIIDREGTAWFVRSSDLPNGECKKLAERMVCCDLSPDGHWLLLVDISGHVTLMNTDNFSQEGDDSHSFEMILPWQAKYSRIDPEHQHVLLGGYRTVQVHQWQ